MDLCEGRCKAGGWKKTSQKCEAEGLKQTPQKWEGMYGCIHIVS